MFDKQGEPGSAALSHPGSSPADFLEPLTPFHDLCKQKGGVRQWISSTIPTWLGHWLRRWRQSGLVIRCGTAAIKVEAQAVKPIDAG